MKQITQKELLETIEAKRQSAENAYVRAHISGSRADVEKNKDYMDAYCYIASVEIVPERNDELDALQYAFTGLLKSQDLAKLCLGEKVKVYTRNKIVGSKTPFESTGEIVRDNGEDIEIQEEDGGHVIVEKKNIKSIVPEEQIVTTIPKAKQEEIGLTEDDLKEMIKNTSKPNDEPKVEPKTCYNCADYLKCKENNIACSNGSGWKPVRNDRFREFFFDNGARRIIDAKAVKSISLEEAYNGDGYYVYVDTIIMKKNESYDVCKNCYENLVEWWKYWKQN